MEQVYSKWVACWGNATSISDRTEAVYSKNLTLRYPITMCFSGNKLRLHFSNLTGTEPIELTKVSVLKEDFYEITFNNGKASITIEPGDEVVSDELQIDITAGDTVQVSIYLENYTQMNAGTLVTGPLSTGQYSYGDFSHTKELPIELTRNTNWFYFLNTIDIYTREENRALICFGDSITAQSWPDYLTLRLKKENITNLSVIRRAVCGTRILRQYDCITYAAYGLKGETRFPIEMNVAGADTVLIQHGINDIIHPVGSDVNIFRPWEDMPTLDDLIDGYTKLYITYAKEKGLKVLGGTLLPIYGWRTYAPFRNDLRNDFNNWIRQTKLLDGVVDFDLAVRNESMPEAFADGFDSGDHLHPSELAYEEMANCIPFEMII